MSNDGMAAGQWRRQAESIARRTGLAPCAAARAGGARRTQPGRPHAAAAAARAVVTRATRVHRRVRATDAACLAGGVARSHGRVLVPVRMLRGGRRDRRIGVVVAAVQGAARHVLLHGGPGHGSGAAAWALGRPVPGNGRCSIPDVVGSSDE
jgi:hypothetical protein